MGKAAYAVLFALLFPAAAFAGDGPESLIPYSDWIIFTLALVVTLGGRWKLLGHLCAHDSLSSGSPRNNRGHEISQQIQS